ncbi:MAG: hypothetical protein LBN96_06630 [Desulfovibrio sp.]|jgi:hypothetical protein|nr:hypothetical protein [Desulfovibrio sp.]
MPGATPPSLFRDPRPLAEKLEACKREIYEKMNPRRRKFIDRIGYENWDPFQKPNDPPDLRADTTKHAAERLVGAFLRDAANQDGHGSDYIRGALDCALGIVNNDATYRGIFDFCLWYHEMTQKEGDTDVSIHSRLHPPTDSGPADRSRSDCPSLKKSATGAICPALPGVKPQSP